MFFIHTDQLNTPRLITNQAAQVVWRWDQTDPFGGNPPNENPSGLGTFTCNLRLPGQYFDKETNTHYNWFRDYDPSIGRYAQSDPIGLMGGLNSYTYVQNSPLVAFDPWGLKITGRWIQNPTVTEWVVNVVDVQPTLGWKWLPPTIKVVIVYLQGYGRIAYAVECTDDMNQCGQSSKVWNISGARPFTTPRVPIAGGPSVIPNLWLNIGLSAINVAIETKSAVSQINSYVAAELAKIVSDPTTYCLLSSGGAR